MAKKKKYDVTYYYHTQVVVQVEAENADEAKRIADSQLGSDECNEQALNNLQEDDDPDVDELGE